jgi:hypothetical protein
MEVEAGRAGESSVVEPLPGAVMELSGPTDPRHAGQRHVLGLPENQGRLTRA